MKPVLFLTLSLLITAGCQPESTENQKQTTELTACTKDGKICPDGQTVGRNPELNCEFNPCPELTSETECMDDMKQCPDGSFVLRDPHQECAFKACPEKSKQTEPVIYCTQEVLQCDDGSYVGRDPNNNCEFKPCPDGSQPERSKPRIE
jgi:hypothetical protein